MTNLTQVELTEKEKLDEKQGGVFVSFSAVIFTGLTVVIVIVATGLLVGFLPEKHCDEIRYIIISICSELLLFLFCFNNNCLKTLTICCGHVIILEIVV